MVRRYSMTDSACANVILPELDALCHGRRCDAGNGAAGANTVSAAAAGTVIKLYQPDGKDWKIVIQVDKSFYYYYDHVTIVAGLASGASVTAGQALGTNSAFAAAVDFGVYNFNN